MGGITMQFASSPVNARITRKTVSASGTVSALLTGSTSLAWRLFVGPSNTGHIRLSTQQGSTQFAPIGAGADLGWIPGNTQNYWFYGTVGGDELGVWELY